MSTAPLSPTLSTASADTASTSTTVIDSHPNPKSLINLAKQLKYVCIGLVLTLYFQVYQHLADALSLGVRHSSSANLALLSLALLVGTVVVFSYIILLPASGYSVNYVDWSTDKHLSTAIPILTACIIFGWTLLLVTLSPIGAPSPPTMSMRQRLAQAATFSGLNNLDSHIASLPSSLFASESLHRLSAGGRQNWDTIATYLGVTQPSKSSLHAYFVLLSHRAEAWSQRNIKTIGWIGAFLGSMGSYLLVFGCVGIVGFVVPNNRASKPKSF